VLCTHLHIDHVGWNTRLRNGRWVPTFPNARYLVDRCDFEYRRQQESIHSDTLQLSGIEEFIANCSRMRPKAPGGSCQYTSEGRDQCALRRLHRDSLRYSSLPVPDVLG